MIDIDFINKQREKISAHLYRTPSIYADRISDILGEQIYLKLENLHYTGSFKERGVVSKLSSLSDDQKQIGVCAVSAGNHAQSLAYHAKKQNIKTKVVMPTNSPFNKIIKTETLGAKVILSGNNLSEGEAKVKKIADEEGKVLVHPFDDDFIRAGQATMGLEFLEDVKNLDCIIVPIGGGGMISGIAVAAHSVNPKVKIYGVQAELCPSVHNMIKPKMGQDGGLSLADGIAVKKASAISVEYINKYIEDVFLVSEENIERALMLLLSEQKILSEGAAATPLAALMNNLDIFRGKKIGLIVSGGNIDTRLLSSVIIRELERKSRICSLRLTVPDQPGNLAMITKYVGNAGLNILEVFHRRMILEINARNVTIDISVEAKDINHLNSAIELLENNGISVKQIAE